MNDIDLLEKIQKMKAEFEQLSAKFSQAYQGVAPDIAEKEINEAVIAIREKCRKS